LVLNRKVKKAVSAAMDEIGMDPLLNNGLTDEEKVEALGRSRVADKLPLDFDERPPFAVVGIPPWWDGQCDRHLLLGLWLYGYAPERLVMIMNDYHLCFHTRLMGNTWARMASHHHVQQQQQQRALLATSTGGQEVLIKHEVEMDSSWPDSATLYQLAQWLLMGRQMLHMKSAAGKKWGKAEATQLITENGESDEESYEKGRVENFRLLFRL